MSSVINTNQEISVFLTPVALIGKHKTTKKDIEKRLSGKVRLNPVVKQPLLSIIGELFIGLGGLGLLTSSSNNPGRGITNTLTTIGGIIITALGFILQPYFNINKQKSNEPQPIIPTPTADSKKENKTIIKEFKIEED